MWSEALAIEWGTWIVTVLIAYSAAAFFAHLSLALLRGGERGVDRMGVHRRGASRPARFGRPLPGPGRAAAQAPV